MSAKSLFIAFGAGLIPTTVVASGLEFGFMSVIQLIESSSLVGGSANELSLLILSAIRCYLIIALVEESLKCLAVIIVRKITCGGVAAVGTDSIEKRAPGSKQWVIMHAQMVAAGFSTAENVMYVFGGRRARSLWWMMEMTLIRSCINLPGHCMYTVISAIRLTGNEHTEFRMRNWRILAPAILFHGSQDFILSALDTFVYGANQSDCHNLLDAHMFPRLANASKGMSCDAIVELHRNACQRKKALETVTVFTINMVVERRHDVCSADTLARNCSQMQSVNTCVGPCDMTCGFCVRQHGGDVVSAKKTPHMAMEL
jgi:RsiW-degrading membrane proteinase PrsW (M82 family)